MALTQRFFRLFQADLHGVLDRLEEPEMLLKQALREMEQELEKSEKTLQGLSREADATTRRQQELAESLARAEHELELCLHTDNEVLARTLIRRKLEMEKLSRHLSRKREELAAALSELRAQLAQNRDHYESVRQKAEMLSQENQLSASLSDGDPGWQTQEFCVREEEVDIALLKEKQRRATTLREEV